MKKILGKLSVVALLGALAGGLCVPHATAEPAVTLAPGVDCAGFDCTNNTDDVYRVHWDALCFTPGSDDVWSTYPTHHWLQPHQRTHTTFGCPKHRRVDHHRHHDHDDEWISGELVDVHYKTAVVENPIPPPFPWPTGSVG